MKLNKIILLYNFLICLLFVLTGIFAARSIGDLMISFIFFPIVLYFLIVLYKSARTNAIGTAKAKSIRRLSLPSPGGKKELIVVKPAEEGQAIKEVSDKDKRAFLKLIYSAGISLFLMALFTKKAQAAFFGSVPGPGTVSLKDSAGNKIDPAEEHPTDGYQIAELDDSGSPAYYGFVKDTGAWYIMNEGSSGSYRYAKGATDFATNWTNRASLTYDYFNTVFGA